MSLVMLVVLLEGVIERTVKPVELGNAAQVPWHLDVLVRLVVVTGTDRVQLFVDLGVDYRVAQVVVGLLPVVLWSVGGVEVDC